ncbi:hypothetical protein HMI54_013790 [Coelomomyces lativittatus]|nr:hypothetical protein HMI55_000672 [Coelomomyces lativittatus]KAJ1514645.1 hypothetical protein HMI54_013790 [Coelomomyces lativittatus]
MLMKNLFEKKLIPKAFANLSKPIEGNHFKSIQYFFLNLTRCTKRYKPSREPFFCQNLTKGEKRELTQSDEPFMKKDKNHLFVFLYPLKQHPNYKGKESNYFTLVEKDFDWVEYLCKIQAEVKKKKSWSNSSLLALAQELIEKN